MKRILTLAMLSMLLGTLLVSAMPASAQPLTGAGLCDLATSQAGTGRGQFGRYTLVFGSGGSGSQVVVGTDGPDVLSGGTGNDIVCGLGGDDILSGGSGNDILVGGPGVDQLSGESGGDTLYGAAGEALDGGTGRNQTVIEVEVPPTTCPNFASLARPDSPTVAFTSEAECIAFIDSGGVPVPLQDAPDPEPMVTLTAVRSTGAACIVNISAIGLPPVVVQINGRVETAAGVQQSLFSTFSNDRGELSFDAPFAVVPGTYRAVLIVDGEELASADTAIDCALATVTLTSVRPSDDGTACIVLITASGLPPVVVQINGRVEPVSGTGGFLFTASTNDQGELSLEGPIPVAPGTYRVVLTNLAGGERSSADTVIDCGIA